MGENTVGPTEFGKRLAEIRAYRELTQHELAAKAGMAPSAISHFESGRREPSLGSLRKLAEALGTGADELLATGSGARVLPFYREQIVERLETIREAAEWCESQAFLSDYRCDEGYFMAIRTLASRAKRSVGRA